MSNRVEEIKAIIEQRRSIRPQQYSSKKISDNILGEILEVAKWAPTHHYTQPWFFTVFTGNEVEKLAAFQSELYKNTCGESQFNPRKFESLSNQPLSASAIIGIGLKTDGQEKNPIVEEIASVSMAVQNMMLLATAFGIGSYWNSGGVTYLEETKSFMGLEEHDGFLGFLYLGYPEKNWPAKTARKPKEQYTNWVKTT